MSTLVAVRDQSSLTDPHHTDAGIMPGGA